MTHSEQTSPERYRFSDEELSLSTEIITLAVEAITDENIEVDRPDVLHITWEDLQSPIDDDADMSEQISRQIAGTEIYNLYMQAMRHIYPELNDVTSPEEMMFEMALIPDLPPCKGSWISSDYVSEDEIRRAITYTEVDLGDIGNVMSVDVIDDNPDNPKMYSVATTSAEDRWLAVGVHGKSELASEEDEMVQSVHPTQQRNIRRVLLGNVRPEDLDSTLMDIRVYTDGMMDDDELDQLIDCAREKYEFEILARQVETRRPSYQAQDLQRMFDIILERIAQLS